MKRTKIVATIGPKSESPKILKQLSEAGVNVFRLNFSHGSHEEHGKKIDNIRKLKLPGAIMLDTKGPEIRTGEVRDKLFVKVGDKFTMTTTKGIYEDTSKISVNYKDFLKDVNVGDTIVFDSGVMLAKAIKKTKTDIDFEVVEGQTNITTKRHINLFGKPVSLPTVTEQDWKDIDFGIEKDIDMIALSFVRSGKDVRDVKEYCAAKGHPNIQIISKIENFEATQNLDDIIIESDGIMVARGDLACEIPFSKVPAMQKKIVALCSFYKKPVIIATQMLLSMVDNIQPTRAEVSDVANAVFETADAVMTSDETTKGIDPVNVINTMAKIVKDTEKEIYGCCPCCNCGCHEGGECNCGDNCSCDDDCDCGCKNGKKHSKNEKCNCKEKSKSHKCSCDDNCSCDDDCNSECACGCYNDCSCGCGTMSCLLDDYADDSDAVVIISDNLDYTNSISKLRLNMPIITFATNKTIVNNLNLVGNVKSELWAVTKESNKNVAKVENIIKEKYNFINKYILIFEVDGNLTIQIRNI